jgi:hypothetical protein
VEGGLKEISGSKRLRYRRGKGWMLFDNLMTIARIRIVERIVHGHALHRIADVWESIPFDRLRGGIRETPPKRGVVHEAMKLNVHLVDPAEETKRTAEGEKHGR